MHPLRQNPARTAAVAAGLAAAAALALVAATGRCRQHDAATSAGSAARPSTTRP